MCPLRTLAGQARRIAVIAFAYALLLNGILGAILAGPQAAEARAAAQLGVICTIHGIGQAGADTRQDDPTPGRLACIEHCTLAVATPATPPPTTVGTPTIWPASHVRVPVFPRDADIGVAFTTRPPPPRGPPSAI